MNILAKSVHSVSHEYNQLLHLKTKQNNNKNKKQNKKQTNKQKKIQKKNKAFEFCA